MRIRLGKLKKAKPWRKWNRKLQVLYFQRQHDRRVARISPSTPSAPIISELTTYADESVVVAIFNEVVSSSDFSLGVTIKKNTASQVISSAILQGDNKTVYYTLSSPIDIADSITFSYDSSTGDIKNTSNVDLASITDSPVKNMLGSYLDFYYQSNSAWAL